MKFADKDILVQLELEDILSDYSITTIGYLWPTHDIVEKLDERIDRDVGLLYDLVEQKGQRHATYASETIN